MLDLSALSWQWTAGATMSCAFGVSLALVLTKRHHGHITLDSTIGVQKFHDQPTPRVGGLGIYLGVLLAWNLVPDRGVHEILGFILLAGLIPLICGLAEDVTKRVGVLPRLLATMAAGVAAWMLTGVCLHRVDVWGVDGVMALTPVAVLFTAFAVGGVANAINIIDGFHGLASGTSIIALAALGGISARAGDSQLAATCLVLAASIAGFWLVNYPWGKLFMGDGGAYFTGFALAWVAVLLPVRNPQVSVWAGLLVCAYPVIEVLYSVVRRRRSRQSPGAPDSGHLHSLLKLKLIRPRLERLGLSADARNAAVAPALWVLAAMPSAAAISFFRNSGALAAALAFSVLVYHLLYRYLTDLPEMAAPARSPMHSVHAARARSTEAPSQRRRHRSREHRRTVRG